MGQTTFCLLDYLNARLLRLGIEMSEVEVQAVCIKYIPGQNMDELIDANNIDKADKATLIPVRDLLLSPDIQEAGYTIKFDKEQVAKWYNAEVNRLVLGNDPTFSLSPKVRNASNFW